AVAGRGQHRVAGTGRGRRARRGLRAGQRRLLGRVRRPEAGAASRRHGGEIARRRGCRREREGDAPRGARCARTRRGDRMPRGRAGRPPLTRRGGGRGGARKRAPSADAPRADKRALGGEQVEGRQAVRELLLAGRRKVREVWLATEDGDERGGLREIASLAEELRVPVKRVSVTKLAAAARSEAPQGVLAKAAPLPEVELETLARTRGGVAPFLVAVDGVTDPGNFGALLRTAECCGATGIVVPRHRSVHVTPTVAKAAAGAVEHLPMAVVTGLPSALERLGSLGVWAVGLDSGG